jgi:hypothetical protein
MADFTNNLARVNKLGTEAPGFVWLLTGGDEGYGATDVAWPGDPDVLVNMSVWESIEALRDYVFGGEHVPILRRRREFFKTQTEATAVLWWIPAGTTPSVHDAKERLEYLNEHGPSAFAFTFQRPFAPEAG